MKTRFILSAILALSSVLCALSSLEAQVPQGFNYQAIACDGVTGNPIANATIKVKLSILSDTTGFYGGTGGVYIWEEEHTNVKTNSQGMFTIVLGSPAATKIQGSAGSFSAIDWSPANLFIGTKIANPTTYKVLGSAKLWSVPYSMMADGISGSVKKLTVVGETANMEEPLFEVKNKNGRTVFAVYNEGVRAYVSDGDVKGKKGGFAIGSFDGSKGERDLFVVSTDSIRAYIYDNPLNKGVKGGFAIGGFDAGKGLTNDYLLISPDSVRIYLDHTTGKAAKKGGFAIGSFDASKNMEQEYLRVSRDSVRIYIDDEAKKAVKGGFAIGSFDASKAGKATFFDVSPNTTDIILSENRILWYPVKNAFLTGRVKIQHPDSVGTNSFASGYESKAKGQYSQALGYLAVARGSYSTAIGKNSLAHKTNSFAFGDGAKAYNQDSYAFGAFTEAHGLGSFAFGYVGRDSLGPTGTVTKALGNYSFAFGLGAQTASTAEGAFAIGSGTSAQGQFSLAMGYKSTAADYYSVAIGSYAQALQQSVAIGLNAYAGGKYSMALRGYASGESSITVGSHARAEGFASVAIGGYSPVPLTVYRSVATGNRSLAVGFGVRAFGNNSISIGNGNYGYSLPSTNGLANGDYSVAFGNSNVAGGGNSFAIGNSNTASASYSLVFGNSNTASSSYSLAFGNSNTASASYSVALGNNTTSTGVYATATGYNTTAQAYISFVTGRYNVLEGTTGSWVDTDPLFVIGNGISTSVRSNAFSVRKDGLTESSGMIRAKGWNAVGTGSGSAVEIFFYSGEGTVQAYDRGTSALMPLRIPSTVLSGHVRPATDNAFGCGSTSLRWTAVYAANGTIQTSDRRMKDNILTLPEGLKTVLGLNPVSFTWRDKSDSKKHIGLIAQEVLPLVPEVVDTGDDENDIMGINYAGLVPVLIKAIQEQQSQIERLEKMVRELQANSSGNR